jgi:hypothetical protein
MEIATSMTATPARSHFNTRTGEDQSPRRLWSIQNSLLVENAALRSQFATGSQKHRDPRLRPYAFTEHGAIMAANVLNSSHPAFKARPLLRSRYGASAL